VTTDAMPDRLGVSVVIPCHNAERFLGAALESVRAQSRPVTEVIVVDDASTDGSGAIATAFGATVLQHASNRGNGAARNTGLRAARSPLVALLDADDAWLPAHVETVAGLLEAHADAVAAFSALRDFGDGVPPRLAPRIPFIDEGGPQWLFERCLRHYVGQPSACVMRRDAALAVGGFSEEMRVGVDFDLWLRLSIRFPFVATHVVTALYRRHDEQISRDVGRQEAMCFRARFAAHRFLEEASDPAAARAGAIIREAWDDAVQRAWDDRRMSDLRTLVDLSAHVPGGAAGARRWRRRARIPRTLLYFWSLAGERLRVPLRRLVALLEHGRR